MSSREMLTARNIAFSLSLVFIFMMPWEGVVRLTGDGGSSTAAKLWGLAVAAFWMATVLITGRFRKPGLFHILFFVFAAWNALSVFWSADVNKTLVQAMTWAQLLGFVVILWDLCTTRAALLAALQAFVFGAYVAVGGAVANFLTGVPFHSSDQRFTAASNVNPDGFGFIVALGIPVAWYLAVSQSVTKSGGFIKWINYAYIPAAFLGISLSGTRTALIAAIPGMAFGILSLSRLRIRAQVGILVLLVSAFLILLPYVQALSSFQRLGTTATELTEGDLNDRTALWSAGLSSFVEHPFLGVGSSMYRSVNSVGKVAHNSFLSVLVEVGLIGFVLFALILMITVVQAWGLPKWDSRFWFSVLLVWAIGASALTWEQRKTTWLFLSLVVVNAAVCKRCDEEPSVDPSGSLGARMSSQPKWVT